MKKRVFDEAFKKMAVELSYVKGSVRQAADELGIDAGRISQWRQRKKKPDQSMKSPSELTDEQKQIKRLQKELKEAQLERDILKRRSASFPGETGDIQIYKRAYPPVSYGPPLRLKRCVRY